MELRCYLLRNRETGERVRSVPTASNETLYDTLERAEVPIRTSCRGSTICGQCWVVVEEPPPGLAPAAPDERALLDRYAPGEPQARLACRVRLPPGVDRLTVSTDYWRPG